MKNKNKFGFGGYVDPISEYLNIKRQRASNIPNQIESPDQAIADNNIRLSRAQQKAMSNPLTQGLDIFGNIAMQVGSSMMSKGISAGGGEDGKGIAGFLNKNQNFINTLLGGLNAGASFATGGVAGNKQINAEGGEVVETPDGLSQELVGPSHAEGGIDIQVPSGTEIYSDRLVGADGKTMAERKKAREKQISKIEKLLQKNPNDKALKKTLEKIKQNNDFLDKQDLSQMQFVKDLVDHTNKFWSGGYAGEDPNDPKFGMSRDNRLVPSEFKNDIYGQYLKSIGYTGKMPAKNEISGGYTFAEGLNSNEIKQLQGILGVKVDGIYGDKTHNALDDSWGKWLDDARNTRNRAFLSTSGMPFLVEKQDFENIQSNIQNDLKTKAFNYSEDQLDPLTQNILASSNTSEHFGKEVYDTDSGIENDKKENEKLENNKKGFSLDDYLGGTTLGDMIGMGANLFGANAQMKNTLENRSATPVEQNWFKDYGKQALSKIQDQYGLLDDIRDNALSSLEKDRAGSISRNNASARSINTQRALNLATDAAINNNKSDLYSKFAQSMLGVKSQEAAQMDRNDQMRMTGEDRRAERELQNTDNFFNNMAKNISDKYRGIGETGKSLNKIKEREVTQKNIEEQLELLKKGTDGELALDKAIAARYGITVEELRNLKNQKNKKG